MPEDASPNGDAPRPRLVGPWSRVSEMQAKLHRWAVADPGRRFDDLFNFVHDPATLIVAYSRVAGNQGARSPGVDGLTVAHIEQQVGASGFLDDQRTAVKAGSLRPLPVRERTIPKPGGSGRSASSGYRRLPTESSRRRSNWCWNRSSRPTFCRSHTGSGPSDAPRTRSPRSTTAAPAATAGCVGGSRFRGRRGNQSQRRFVPPLHASSKSRCPQPQGPHKPRLQSRTRNHR